jgi:tetratricopeptide (TPR) repeat protein
MRTLGTPIYRCEGIEIDPAQGCLRRNGEDLYPRQKSFQVLVYLLEHRHRLVSKNELIQHAWEGLAVSDDALVQLIKEIRQSLGDDHRQPRFIKTVPKAGYRFIGAVEEFHQDFSPSVEIERHSSVEIEYEEEILDGEAGQFDETVARSVAEETRARGRNQASPFRGRVSFSARVVVLALASIVLVTTVFAAYFQTRLPRRSEQLADVTLPVMPGKRAVAVMYFENQSNSSDLEWLREGLADMVITDLSRSNRLNVLSRQQLYLLLERSGHPQTEVIRLNDAMQIARKTGADAFVLGSYVRLGERIRIDVQLHNAQNGQSLASESLVADEPQNIIAQVELLSLKLAEHLGVKPEVSKGSAQIEVMTTNLEAYRYYSLAVEKAQGLHNTEAIALLEKAIALDPQFAMAHARLGYAYAVSWNFPDKAKPYLEKAFQLADRLSEKDRLNIKGWYAIANLDYPQAIAEFQEIVAKYPMETEAYNRLGSLLTGEGRLNEALEVVLRGLVVDAESPILLNQISSIYYRLGKYDEAINACQRYITVAPHEANAYDSLGLYYQWAGHYAEAIASYEQAVRLNPEFEVAVVHLGNTYFQQGRYREALEQYNRYIQMAPSNEERARGYNCIAQIYWKQGDLIQAEKAAKQSLACDKRSLGSSIIVSLERGNVATAEAIGKRLFADRSNASNRGQRMTLRYPHYLQGYIHLKSGRPEEALAEFQEALRCSALFWEIDAYEDCLANAYLDLGRFDEAIAEYQRILRVNPNYPRAQYHLGQAYERKGEREQALLAYKLFLQVWKDADAALPEVISAKNKISAT